MESFHFALGPVQGFVSQARRTRDFWAGSFLLSHLTAHAMKATQDHGGKIVMPDVREDELLKRVRSGVGNGPTIGTLPNCFEASVKDGFDVAKVEDAVKAEWKRIAKMVWDHDKLTDAGVDEEIWNGQINNFWEIAWVIADPKEDAALAMRKNWRNHYPPVQLGDKCSIMGEWQELSGEGKPRPKKQQEFWEQLRRVSLNNNQLELRDGERLCAISYVKRRFAAAWNYVEKDWKLPTGVPSTSYMAAVHWIEQVLKHADSGKIETFLVAAKSIVRYGEWNTSIACIERIRGDGKDGHRFASLDGRVFFRSALENEADLKEERAKKEVLNALNALAETQISPGQKLGHPSPFYAILVMDGDNLGATKQAMGGDATRLSSALASFTSNVSRIVNDEYNGFLVYSGGDDVLAILPLEDALKCALELRSAYMQVFKSEGITSGYSISAAIIYAHMKLPLTLVLKDCHALLDDIAKDATGRDALAVRVWKPGGLQLTWSMKWEKTENAKVESLNKLVKKFQKAEDDKPGHASKPLFRIRERLEMLKGAADFNDGEIRNLLVAEYVTSGVLSKDERKQQIAENRIDQLVPLCEKSIGGYGAEAAMLIRFLAQKGVER